MFDFQLCLYGETKIHLRGFMIKGQEMFTQLTQKISVAVIYLVMQQPWVWKAAANLFQ